MFVVTEDQDLQTSEKFFSVLSHDSREERGSFLDVGRLALCLGLV